MELFTIREVSNYFDKIAQKKRDKNELALSQLEAYDFIVKLLNSQYNVNNDVTDLKKLIRKEK